MKARRVQLKLYVQPGTLSDSERVVPVFHDWIRRRILDELLIDVARYGHVHDGPAVMLVGGAGDYTIDRSEGRLGLMVTRKHVAADDESRLSELFQRALHAAKLLEDDDQLSGLRFCTDEMLLVVPDRLNAPNTVETFGRLSDEIEAQARDWVGPVRLEHEGSPRQPFSVRIRRAGDEDPSVGARSQ